MQTLLNYRPGIAMMQRIDQYSIEAIVYIFFLCKHTDGVQHNGVCSSFLNTRNAGDFVPCYVKRYLLLF